MAATDSTQPRRRLGDAWSDWDGEPESQPSQDAPLGVFLWPALLALGTWAAALAILWFLVEPRLAQAWMWLPDLIAALLTALAISGLAWWARLTWLATGRGGLGLSRPELLVLLKGLLPWTLRIGRLTGSSPDRLTNAFLKLHNTLVQLAGREVDTSELVILLPRCLDKPIRRSAQDMARTYGCHLAIVPGGGEARRVIREHRPRAVIAVACERDLLSGIEEVSAVIPVFALPNRRPAGPCVCTEIDLDDLDDAVCSFLGRGGTP
jgi:hypothetical protein